MEEEYRMQKTQVDTQTPASSTVIHEDGRVTAAGPSLSTKESDDNASTKGVRSVNHSPNPSGTVANGIPTIRISTESQRESRQETATDAEDKADEEPEEEHSETNGVTDPEQTTSQAVVDSLERPMQAAAGEASDDSNGNIPSPAQLEAFSFSNKRLCERWLDNLFMVLYEVKSEPKP